MLTFISIQPERLRQFSIDLLKSAADISEENAAIISDNLVSADIRGVKTHGVTRLGAYLELVKAGQINTDCNVELIKDCNTTMRLDAGNTFGQIGAYHGMRNAIERADKYGFSFVVVGNSGHIGALAHWTMMALEHGMIGICFTNTSSIMAPFGSREGLVGNNPISIAAPASCEMPLVLDMALSVAARGHLAVAIREGREVPLGWAIDAEGVPTTDPAEGQLGAMVPIGGYKGSGLSIMLEVMSAILSDSPIAREKGALVPPDKERPLGLSHSFLAIKIENFQNLNKFKSDTEALIEEVKGSAKAAGVDEILVPNQKEFSSEQKSVAEGIQLDSKLVDELALFAREYNVPFFA